MTKKHLPEWETLLRNFGDQLSEDDLVLLRLLSTGNSTPKIAAMLSVNRSRIWRRAQRLKADLVARAPQFQGK